MIDLNQVTFSYQGVEGNQQTLNHFSLHIPKGQLVVLAGRSGCGKTTVTRLINGLIPHFYEGNLSGSVWVDGRQVPQVALYDNALSVATVFQNPKSQFFNVDTYSEMAFSLENRGEHVPIILKRVREEVERYKIGHLMHRNIFQLSGGEKQKLACASISVSEPEVLVFDEPSANLDIMAIQDLKENIAHWKRQGKTIVVAEHRLYYLWELMDRLVILEDGRMIEDIQGASIRDLDNQRLHQWGLRSFKASSYTLSDRPTNDNKAIPTIQFDQLYFEYQKNHPVVNCSNLKIKEGNITAIVGHNGHGKTTLLRCLCGLEKKCRCQMSYRNKAYNRRDRLKTFYLVMQDVNHQLFAESVLDEVLISMANEDEEKAKALLQEFDLLDYQERHPISLSGGQKQRLAVATALASDRDILAFDEPTSGLDYYHMLQVVKVIKSLKNRGKTVLIVTHDWEFIHALGAEVMTLEKINNKGDDIFENSKRK